MADSSELFCFISVWALHMIRRIGSIRKNGQFEDCEDQGLRSRWWVLNQEGTRWAIKLEEENGGDPIEVLVQRARFGPNLVRLLLGCHWRVVSNHELAVSLEYSEIADFLWGSQTKRPKNWKQVVRGTVASASMLILAFEKTEGNWEGGPLLISQEQDDLFRIELSRQLLGELGGFANENGLLEFVSRVPTIHDSITKDDIDKVRAEGHPGLTATEIREVVKNRRRYEDEHTLSLSKLGRQKRITKVFLPALLGDRVATAEIGDVVTKLLAEKTRDKPVSKNWVPGRRQGSRVQCPILEPEREYAVFGGNDLARFRGRTPNISFSGKGYRLATWSEKFGCNVDAFLGILKQASERLGLIVAGIDHQAKWYSLSELLHAPIDVLRDVLIRVYTEADFIARWSFALGWPTSNQPGVRSLLYDMTDLFYHVRRKGISEISRQVGCNRSALSLIVSGKRKPSSQLLQRVREAIGTDGIRGGEGLGSIFASCASIADYALAYLQMGFSIVPMPPGSKTPYVRWKEYQTWRPTRATIARWWSIWPDANIAIVLGPVSNVFAVDVDDEAAYRALVARLGGEPAAPKVMSGSGDPFRMHFYFTHPDRKTKARLRLWHPRLEFLGKGSLLVLPPSLHKSGNHYRWAPTASLEEVPLPPLPAEICQALTDAEAHAQISGLRSLGRQRQNAVKPSTSGNASQAARDKSMGETGFRNERAFNRACQLFERGTPFDQALNQIKAAIKLEDPAHEAEITRTVQSASDRIRSKINPRQGASRKT